MDEEKAERVSGDELVDATLELSGFCLGTIVVRDAMLLPASANIVASFRGRYFGFADDASLERFVAAPARHVRALLRAARKAPELIHMLRLQEHFPASSIAEIMRNAALAAGGASKSLLAPTRSFADSCVQTPTHFVEKNIDEYSEKENLNDLDRKLLQSLKVKNERKLRAHHKKEKEIYKNILG